ncbi:MAG: hypothetical protein M3Y71_01445 [Actinomycetota bacterium]|nr:hypothetical protein [Actinomycetota bacterium]
MSVIVAVGTTHAVLTPPSERLDEFVGVPAPPGTMWDEALGLTGTSEDAR